MTEASSPIDLSSCAAEPIHRPGSIQPHGCLIGCTMPDWAVTHLSANIAEILEGADPAGLLGASLEALLPAQVIHDIRNTLQASMVSGTAETLSNVALGGGIADISVHISGPQAIIEVVPQRESHAATATPLILVRSMLGRLRRAPTLERALAVSTTQLRAVTGFDRVMIYKFLDDDSGEVVAEAVRSGLTPFLGLRYPASDIPPQARELYKRQWLRLIPDTGYAPSPLLSREDGGGTALDLSLATLRSVSPVHLEYLDNMGSKATLTISLITGDRLWGLVACHHEVPRRLATSTCAACELFGQIFSLQIEAKEQERELSLTSRAREAHEKLIASMPPEETLFDNLARYSDLLNELITSDGIGIWTAGVFSGFGTLPPVEAMPDLVAFLGRGDPQQVYVTEALDAEFPAARFYRDRASGLIAIPFSRAPRDYLLFFRRELLQTITWGGNPNKPVEVGATGRIGPRRSFDAWREEVSGRSQPWRPIDVKIAEALRVSLLDVILRRAELVEQERRSAQESQTLLVAELNHRVKNILALIRALVRQSRQGTVSIAAFTADFEKRIQALSLAHDQMTESGWSAAPIKTLLEAEAEAWTRQSREGLVFKGPNVLLDTRAYQTMALVFHEMMTNAAKYGALSTPRGSLNVTWEVESDGRLAVVWKEAGGPPVQAPARRGFGTVVVEQTIPFELQGEARVEYRFEGIQGRFKIPSRHFSIGEEIEAKPKAELPAAHADFMGERLLIVEDSMMIALDAQAALQDSEIKVDVAGTVSDALRAIELDRFDAAVLDINLSGETSFGVADACVGRGVPFVFATGYGESVIIPDRFLGTPVVSKPYDAHALRSALGQAVDAMSSAESSGDTPSRR